MTGYLQKIWDYLKNANSYWKDKTQPIKGKSIADRLESLRVYFKLDEEDQAKLLEHQQEKGFIDGKVDEINDYASHRAAFIANAFAHLLLVNLSSLSLLGIVPASWFKVLFIGANLFFALLAWWRFRAKKRKLLHGPSEEPEWSLWGIFRGNRRKHNKHIKELAQPFKVRMRDERLFSIMYVVNAVLLLFAGQFMMTADLPSLLKFIANIPLFLLTIPLAIANGYWAFSANNQVVKAAVERGSKLDELKL